MNGPELRSFSRMVRGWFRGLGAPVDLEDVEQDAALAVLETEAKKGLPLEGNRTYYFRAAKCEAGLAMAKRVAAVSVTEWAIRGGSGGWGNGSGGWPWGNRVAVAGCGFWPQDAPERIDRTLVGEYREGREVVDIEGGIRRSSDLSEREIERERLMRILAEHIDELPRRDRRPLRLILGMAGAEPVEPAVAAKRTRRSRAAVAAATRRLAEAVRADAQAIEARRVTSGR